MLPVGMLMKEHRLIEKMIKAAKAELSRVRQQKEININFIDSFIDFLQIYADRCHHGKEEDILFKALSQINLSPEHKRAMNKLLDDHRRGRRTVGRLKKAKEGFCRGNKKSLVDIKQCLQELVELYTGHIFKEDKHFFLPVMEYFDKGQQQQMIAEFRQFDQKMIHEKYRRVVKRFIR
jgi:hemerythrin-like domain-containing protein